MSMVFDVSFTSGTIHSINRWVLSDPFFLLAGALQALGSGTEDQIQSHVRSLELLYSQVGPGDFDEYWHAAVNLRKNFGQDTFNVVREANSPN